MYENKISARQLRRMIFIETFGAEHYLYRHLPAIKNRMALEPDFLWGVFGGNDCLFYYFFWENK